MKIYGELNMRGRFWCRRVSRITNVIWNQDSIGRFLYAKETDSIWFGGNTDWKQITHAEDLINNGQEMLFMSYPFPDNWNIKTGDLNDRIVLTETTSSQIGDTGGSWTITGMNTQNVRHNHFAPTGMGQSNQSVLVGKSERYRYLTIPQHTHYMNNDTVHTHAFDGSWRPAYTLGSIGFYESE